MRNLLFILILLSALSCKKLDLTQGKTSMSEDFEQYQGFTTTQLIDSGNWTNFVQIFPENTYGFDTTTVHNGSRSFRFTAIPTQGQDVSKCDLHISDLVFQEHDIVRFSAWYYISGPTKDLVIADFETGAEISLSPGMRIAINQSGQLYLERKKMIESSIQQDYNSAIDFPTDRWVHVEFEFRLSVKKKGYVKIWQDGQLIIDKDKVKTNPTDELYITCGTAAFINSLEVGITANGTEGSVTMFVDEISIRKL